MAEVLLDAGVVDPQTGRSHNPIRRTAMEQALLANYAKTMVKLWLRVRVTLPLQELRDRTEDLKDLAKSTQLAAIWSLQAVYKKDPVYTGPVNAADVMLSGFQHASMRYSSYVAKYVDTSMGDADMAEFSWGPSMAMIRQWCDDVPAVDIVPKRKIPKALPVASPTSPQDSNGQIKKSSTSVPTADLDMSTQSPAKRRFFAVGSGHSPGIYTNKADLDKAVKGFPSARTLFTNDLRKAEEFLQKHRTQTSPPKANATAASTPSKQKAAAISKSDTPKPKTTPVKSARWFAAKGTSRPGIYQFKHVAEAYDFDGTGVIKMFKTLPEARVFLKDPAPRCYRESEAHVLEEVSSDTSNDLLSPHKFYAVKGGNQSGIYLLLADALNAVCDGGGRYAVFNSKT